MLFLRKSKNRKALQVGKKLKVSKQRFKEILTTFSLEPSILALAYVRDQNMRLQVVSFELKTLGSAHWWIPSAC